MGGEFRGSRCFLLVGARSVWETGRSRWRRVRFVRQPVARPTVGGMLAEPGSSTAANQGGGDGVEAVAEAAGFPPAGVVTVEGEELQPGGQVAGQRGDRAPDLVLVRGRPVGRRLCWSRTR